MSDAVQIIQLVVGAIVSITLAYLTYLTVKVKQQQKENTEKLDQNTQLTKDVGHAATTNAQAAVEAANSAADRAEEIKTQLNGSLDNKISNIVQERMEEHHQRLCVLEGQMIAFKGSLDAVNKNIDATRHEMRGNLQTIMNKIDISAALKAKG